MAILKQIIQGTVTIASGATLANVTIPPVDLAKTFHFMSYSGNNNGPNKGGVASRLTSTTNFRVERYTGASSAPAVTIQYYIMEFVSGVTVQRGLSTAASVDAGGFSVLDIPISAVDLTKSFATVKYSRETVDWAGREHVISQLTSSTNLRLLNLEGGALPFTAAWEVVQYDNCKVTQLSSTWPAANTTIDVFLPSAVNKSKTLYIPSVSWDNDVENAGQKSYALEVISNDTLRLSRGQTSAYTGQYHIYAVSFLDPLVKVQHGKTVLTTLTNSPTIQRVDTAKSAIYMSGQYGVMSSLAADGSYANSFVKSSFSSSTSILLERAASAIQATTSWQAIDFNAKNYLPSIQYHIF